MNQEQLLKFSQDYTAAWCSRIPEKIAGFYSPNGFLAINGGEPAAGTAAIIESVRAFIVEFPDIVVKRREAYIAGNRAIYKWTLIGTHAVTGRKVTIDGHEDWKLDEACTQILESYGTYDAADYKKQAGLL
jgi:hypothetical protein